jgi:hypothetical protein
MLSNDSLTYLGISLCAFHLLVTIDGELSWPFACLLGIAITVTVFVKYSVFIVLPMIAAPLMALVFIKSSIPRSKAITALLLAVLVPLIFLGGYMSNNYSEYGKMLPWNDTMINTSAVHPHDQEGISFASFTPWQYINEPLVIPGQMHSFWTLIYSGMWVDSEPRFTNITRGRSVWWTQYFDWMRGDAAFPTSAIPISITTRIISAGLLVCGMVPLVLILAGFARCIFVTVTAPSFETVKLQAFPIMVCFNAIGVIYLVCKAPVYSSMKASYFLNSMPAFSAFIAVSVQRIENNMCIKKFIILVSCVIVLLTSIYIIGFYLAISPFHGWS